MEIKCKQAKYPTVWFSKLWWINITENVQTLKMTIRIIMCGMWKKKMNIIYTYDCSKMHLLVKYYLEIT